MKSNTLKESYLNYKEAHPKSRNRNIADALQVSELEILEVADNCQISYLGDDYKSLLKDFDGLGPLMALTRNDHAVHETTGDYKQVSFMKKMPMGIAHNKVIDLRYFFHNWAHVYAVEMPGHKKTVRSIQFFDVYGNAVHKVYCTKHTNMEAYDHMLSKHTEYHQKERTSLEIKEATLVPNGTNLLPNEIERFQKDWLEMKDTHDFFGLLKKNKLKRQEAFRIAPQGAAYRVENDSIVKILQLVVEHKVPIMVFLSNPSCLQIYSGPIRKLLAMNEWYNILDPKFNLHLKLDAIAETWIVKKYTSDGIVTSIELFDKDDQQIIYCFGERKPGIPELEGWRAAIEQMKKIDTTQ